MKPLKLIAICLVLVLVAATSMEADAGLFKKSKKKARTEKSEEEMTPRRFDNYPNMQFKGGILSSDAHSGWKVGETPLFLGKDCVITMADSDEAMLQEGRRAVVMGSMVGGAINALSIYISEPSYQAMGLGDSKEEKEAGPNPNVGRIVKPAE